MSEAEWKPIWVRGGRIEHVVWIGKDVLAWGLGNHIVFYNIPQKRESLRWSSKPEHGDGVSCLSGHLTNPVLAFAEKTLRSPKILVLAYPSMKTVAECSQPGTTGYLATEFTSTDHLISLDSYPTFTLTIWSWRKGLKLASVDTSIHDFEKQLINVSGSKPPFIGQLGRSSGKLHIWEMTPAGKAILLTGHEVTLPGNALPYYADWSAELIEPQLAIVDHAANIYIANHNGTEVYRIVLTIRCTICLEYEAPAVRWFRDGLILRTTFCQIRFYKKDAKDFWRTQWYVKSLLKPTVLSVHPSRNTRLFYHTQEGFLMELNINMNDDQENPLIERKLDCGGFYRFMDMIHPWGHYFMAIDDTNQLSILSCYDGRQVATLNLELEGVIMQLSSHPDYPLAVAISMMGELVFASLHKAENPSTIAKLHVHNERLDLLKFSHCGKYLVVGQRTSGVCYFLGITGRQPFVVNTRLQTKCRMADVLLYETRGRLKLFVLVVSSRIVTVGHYLAVYDVQTYGENSTEPIYYLKLPFVYQFLHYASEENFFVGTPYLSRQLHLLEIRDWEVIHLAEAIPLKHDVRRPRLFTSRNWILSTTLGGKVTLRNGRTRKQVATLRPHHRRDLGTQKAVVKASGDIIISLGHNGSLIGMRFPKMEKNKDPSNFLDYYKVDSGEYDSRKKEILADYASLDHVIVEMLAKRIDTFPPMENGVKKTWIEWSDSQKILRETEQNYEKKSKIREDFENLRNRVVELLDANEMESEVEKLPIAVFNLDKARRDSILRVGREEREDARLELMKRCASMDRVAKWLKSTFWNPQKVPSRSIFAIFEDTEVTNYAAVNEELTANEMLELARFFRDSMRAVMEVETFCPWRVYSPSQLQLALQRQFHSFRVDERQRMDELLAAEDEERESSQEEIESRLAIEGMTTYHFIKQNDYYYSQFECYGFTHLLLNNRYLMNDCKMLRNYFNKIFEEVFASKEHEIEVIREKHERIRYIDKELRSMFGQSVSNVPIDPAWKWKEQPDSIVTVKDDELKVKPYISPSIQEVLDKQAVEMERLRQLLLADDFREKALIRMMDGVLEVCWEDTIKRDIPKPECMLTKDPDQFNADDLLAVRRYNKDVEFLESERTRYHRMLESELVKIGSTLRETVDKFNAKIHDLYALKMRIEAAIQQLNLRNVRDYMRHIHRMEFYNRDDEARKEITNKLKTYERLKEELRTFQALAQEYRIQCDAHLAREKAVEKKFRSEFPHLGKGNVESLQREYKQRPRINLKNMTTGELLELGRNVSSRAEAIVLNHESVEYLKALEIWDQRPAGLSITIENSYWEHLVRIRRHKIELEMKTKAQMAELNETEKSITAHENKMARIYSDVDADKERIIAMRRERIEFDFDMEIQLVLKMGQVEVRPDGKRDGMTNVLLIPRREIETVNEKIVHAGQKKLKIMNHTINFRRGIVFMEWEHRCLKMEIDDLQDELRTIENVLVRRDMRELLNKDFEGSKEEKTVLQLEKEIDKVKKNCKKILGDWLVRLEEVTAKIQRVKQQNASMNRKMMKMNVDRWELEMMRDIEGEIRQKRYHDRIMHVVTKRGKLVRKLNKEYTEVLALQTEYELLRLRKFPTLNYFKTLNDDPDFR